MFKKQEQFAVLVIWNVPSIWKYQICFHQLSGNDRVERKCTTISAAALQGVKEIVRNARLLFGKTIDYGFITPCENFQTAIV